MSFITDYLTFTSNNESPVLYHKWACLATLGALAGRRFWFNLGPFRYYPNFYTVLVGDAGVKKSTAHDMSKEVIRKVEGIPIAATSTTKEAITKEMGHDKYRGKKFFPYAGTMEEYNQLAIYATELTTFLGVAPENMIDFLTMIYTEKNYDERYKNTGNTFFAGPYITMLACMTPTTMKGYLKQAIITTGFARRTVFVWSNRGKPIAVPGYTEEHIAALARCVEWGKKLQHFSNELTFDEDGWKWYRDWYEDNYNKVPDRKPNLQSYFLTKHEFMIKTGILLTLSEDGPEAKYLTAPRMEYLLDKFFAPMEVNLDRVFEGAGQNKNAEVAAQVCRMLEALDRPMNKKKLMIMFGDQATSWREFEETLGYLCSSGRLARKDVTADGKPVGTVIGTPGSIARLSATELASILLAAGPPDPLTDTGQS